MPDMDGKNTITDIKNFLETKERPIEIEEFSEFWKSLSDEEKETFRTSNLS